eukprot:1382702-Prymnesium_polylepis.1
MVVHQRRWLERYFATIVTDRLHPHPTTRHRIATAPPLTTSPSPSPAPAARSTWGPMAPTPPPSA